MLEEFFAGNPNAAVALSGGVDSSYLLFCAAKYGKNVTGYFVKTEFQPDFELEDAKRIAAIAGAELKIINLSVLEDKAVATNPVNRCYLCKKLIFSNIINCAKLDGYELLLDGSNTDDNPAERPGMKALYELGVCSPLREAGLSKTDIRRLSREAGLFTWNKPSYSCLATRIPAGCVITREMLEKTERGEEKLFEMGFTDFRLRWLDGRAKLELRSEQMTKALLKRADILAALKDDYSEVLMDLKERPVGK